MAEIQLSEEVRSALDRIDWSALEVPRSVVEANPKVAEQLAAGKATKLVTYSVQIPGIPEPTEKTVQLNGFYQPLYDSNLDTLRKYGARWDIIGMSLYPYWALDSGLETDEDEAITHCMQNISHVWDKYHTPVMIVETGFEVDESHPEVMEKGRDQLRRIIRESKATGHCEGIFYWEPECRPFQYKLGAFDSEGKPTVIMDGFED